MKILATLVFTSCVGILTWSMLDTTQAQVINKAEPIGLNVDEGIDDDGKSRSIRLLSEKSDLVIVGDVISSKSVWYKKSIVTLSEITPLSVMKGDIQEESITVVFFGGTVGNINQQYTHSAILNDDEIAVFFLEKEPDEVSKAFSGYRIVDEHGKIQLVRPGESKTRLENNERLKRFVQNVENLVKEQ